jgi:protein CLEC16A
VTKDNENNVIEILRLISEMVVYGDNKSELLFDFFCEKNMLSLFLEIMWTEVGCPPGVHIQILQTLSILVNCVKNDTSLYYLLSNNYINEIIIYPHDFDSRENDGDSLRDQFISFLKSLSIRLNCLTVQFFFLEKTGAFPLLTR